MHMRNFFSLFLFFLAPVVFVFAQDKDKEEQYSVDAFARYHSEYYCEWQ